MEEIIHVPEEQSETGNLTEYTESVVECFDSVPEVAKPLIGSAGRLLNRIEKMLYSAPAFVGAVKAVIPEEAYQVILTDEQKAKIASGALKLMTKKDGSLMANLINPETKKIVSTVSLGKVKLSPELSQAMTPHKCRWLKSRSKFNLFKSQLKKSGKVRSMIGLRPRIAASKS